MKKLSKLLLCLALVAVPFLLAGCSSVETELPDTGSPAGPDNPQANDPNRRSVVISLQNKLILIPAEPESRVATRDGIAEEDENRIAGFDIYAFSSDKEEGPYTFQEHFAYRSDGSQPTGTSRVDLKADEATGKVNVMFYPRKGLYTKFYCLANRTELRDAAGTLYTNYISLQQSSGKTESIGDQVIAPGTPTESDFCKLTTPLLASDNPGDVLLAPLPMSGATGQAVDLREYSMGTFVRLNIQLTRTVARFDIVNNAEESHFTITDISLGNGRRGVSLFPIRPVGDLPAATGQLITYPDRMFNGQNANKGVTTKAFYSYPCPSADEGFLILKGLYAINQTDLPKEVSYRIPFEQVTDGSGSRIEINHNHRYTVQITKADPFELVANIKLVDWETGSSIDDYEPDNKLDAIVVSDLLPIDETTYTEATGTISMPLKPGSSFVVTTGSNAGVEAVINYLDGSPANTGWLKIESIPLTRAGTQSAQFKISLDASYTGWTHSRGLLRIIDKAGGGENLIIVNPVSLPTVLPVSSSATVPGEKLNWLHTDTSVLNFYRVTGSEVEFAVICPDGVVAPASLPAGFKLEEVERSTTNESVRYKLILTDRDVIIADDKLKLEFQNQKDPTLVRTMTVQLHDTSLMDINVTPVASGNAVFTPDAKQIAMHIVTNSAFTMEFKSYEDISVEKDFAGTPEWMSVAVTTTPPAVLKAGQDANAFTRGTTEPLKYSHSVRFSLNPTAKRFAPSTVIFRNKCGGPDYELSVLPNCDKPVITQISKEPSVNSYVSSGTKTLNLYQLKTDYYSTVTLQVNSLGGSKLELPEGVEADRLESDERIQKYVIKYKHSGNNLVDDLSKGILNVKNLSEESKKEEVKVTIKSSLPKIGCSPAGISASRTDYDVDIYTGNHWNCLNRGDITVTFTSPMGYQYTGTSTGGNANTQTTVTAGNQGGSAGSITNPFTIAFKNTLTTSTSGNLYYYSFTAKDNRFPDYKAEIYTKNPIYQGRISIPMGGLYITPCKPVTTLSAAQSAANAAGNGWRVPSMADFRKIMGWTASEFNDLNNTSVRNLKNDKNYMMVYMGNTGNYWSSDTYNGSNQRVMNVQSTTTGKYNYTNSGSTCYYILVHDN